MIVTVVKESCDGEDIMIRAYESQGRRTGTEFILGFEAGRAAEVDMMEQMEFAPVPLYGRSFRAELKPYEIKTFRISGGKWGDRE